LFDTISPFHHSLIFESKARIGDILVAPLGYSPAFSINIGLGWLTAPWYKFPTVKSFVEPALKRREKLNLIDQIIL
jgi:hypothetical protein